MSEKLYKGIFWIRDDLALEESVSYCILIPCDSNGIIDISYQLQMTSKTKMNHNHRIYWNSVLNSRLKNGKAFDYYPRGRIEIHRQTAKIFLNPHICSKNVKAFLISIYNLHSLKRIILIPDCSIHYKCHLDEEK